MANGPNTACMLGAHCTAGQDTYLRVLFSWLWVSLHLPHPHGLQQSHKGRCRAVARIEHLRDGRVRSGWQGQVACVVKVHGTSLWSTAEACARALVPQLVQVQSHSAVHCACDLVQGLRLEAAPLTCRCMICCRSHASLRMVSWCCWMRYC